jgi:transcriptional regulator with XRE-family HTH domain
MPRKPRFVHPLRCVRNAVGMSQTAFANAFGVSASFIQAIELGERNLNDDLADKLTLRYGISARSLRQKQGVPRHLFDSNEPHPLPRIPASEKARMVVHHGLTIPQAMKDMFEEFRALKRIKNQRKRLRAMIAFWKAKIVPTSENKGQVLDVAGMLDNKLALLFIAAQYKNKYFPLAMRLNRWIDNQVHEYRLRTTIDGLRRCRSGRDALWPAFINAL